jgi:hypothetical protein
MIADVASEEPPEVLGPWYGRWVQRLDAVQQRFSLMLANVVGNEDVNAGWTEQLQLMQQQREQIHAQLNTDLAPEFAAETRPRLPPASDMLQWSAPENQPVAQVAFSGFPDGLQVTYTEQDRSGLLGRLLAAMVIVAAAAGVALLRRRLANSWRAFIVPGVAGFGLGLVCWLWLSPSALGLAILLVVALGILQRDWRP